MGNVSAVRPLHIGVLVGATKFDTGPHFFLDLILERFRNFGHSISLIAPKTRIPSDLDAGILHVAATRVPEEIVARMPGGLPVVNCRVLDISKRRVSRMLVAENDPVHGPVIVKSDANFAGRNDFARLGRVQRRLRILTQRLRGGSSRADSIPYEIYESVSKVPRHVWSSRERVVERFIPELEGELYCLRKWVFLGDVDLQVISRSSQPIIKASNARHAFIHDPVHPELVAERNRLGFDYGKFDYVMHNGRPVLLDANSTPGISARSPQLVQSADELASSLQRWVWARVKRDRPITVVPCEHA
jgi:hypothetical protein